LKIEEFSSCFRFQFTFHVGSWLDPNIGFLLFFLLIRTTDINRILEIGGIEYRISNAELVRSQLYVHMYIFEIWNLKVERKTETENWTLIGNENFENKNKKSIKLFLVFIFLFDYFFLSQSRMVLLPRLWGFCRLPRFWLSRLVFSSFFTFA
jgi:hypothetical protein